MKISKDPTDPTASSSQSSSDSEIVREFDMPAPPRPPPTLIDNSEFVDDSRGPLMAEMSNLIIVAATISLICLMIAIWCFFCQFKAAVNCRRPATFLESFRCYCRCCPKADEEEEFAGKPSETHSSLHIRRDSLTITNLPRSFHAKEGRKCSSSLFNDLVSANSMHSLEPIKCDCKNYSLLGPEEADKDNFRGRSLSHFIRSPKTHHHCSALSPHGEVGRADSLSPNADLKPRAFSMSRAHMFHKHNHLRPNLLEKHCRKHMNTIYSDATPSDEQQSGENSAVAVAAVGYQQTVVKVPVIGKDSRPYTEVRSASVNSNHSAKNKNIYRSIEKDL